MSKPTPTWKSALTETLTSVFPKAALAPACPFTPAWAATPFVPTLTLALTSPLADASALTKFCPFTVTRAPTLYSLPTFAPTSTWPF